MAAGDCPDWTVSYEGGGADFMDALDADQKAAFEGMAVDFLWRWTGGRVGTCPVEIRPCRQACVGAASTFWGRGPYSAGTGAPWTPVLISGHWYNLSCGSCGLTCSCGPETPALVLPGPVASVTTVTVDGVVLPASSYQLNGNELRRIDGLGWPVCQDMDAPATEAGTWAVEYLRGTPVPVGGQIAAGLLAVELVKASTNDSTCQLPRRLQSITRQGVTVAVLDSFDDIEKGHTGIWLVDSWVASMTRAPMGGTVRSPDVPRKGRYSTPPPPPLP